MSDLPEASVPPQGQFLVYATEDGRVKIDVRLEDETVWLTQRHMADLFQTSPQNIGQHLKNIYAEGELLREATCKECLQVRWEGSRKVQRRQDYYNLDAIISVGYRVKSAVATRFRIWATHGSGAEWPIDIAQCIIPSGSNFSGIYLTWNHACPAPSQASSYRCLFHSAGLR